MNRKRSNVDIYEHISTHLDIKEILKENPILI